MTTYYQRFRDPRVNYVMVVIGIEQDNGSFGGAFHVRMTEEEYENLEARSRRQAQRGEWPRDKYPPTDYRPPTDRTMPRTEPSRPFEPEPERPFFTGEDFSFSFTTGFDGFEKAFFEEKRREEERQRKARERAREQKDNPTTAPKRNDGQARMRLAELAGVEWPTDIPSSSLYKRAQRKCHPDLEGGSHELWIELEGIARQLKLIKVKDTTGSARYTGRSAG